MSEPVDFPVGDIPCTERKRLVDIVNSDSGQVTMKQLMPMEHDWRLWERKRLFRFGAKAGEGKTDPFFTEMWYCIRCRHIETRRST